MLFENVLEKHGAKELYAQGGAIRVVAFLCGPASSLLAFLNPFREAAAFIAPPSGFPQKLCEPAPQRGCNDGTAKKLYTQGAAMTATAFI